MVIGNGLISNSFNGYIYNKDYLIFASGVSNSKEDRDCEYEREYNLIKNYINTNSKFIYFSTINNGDSKYFLHKKNMENYIIDNSNNYLIFRLPNVVGDGGNINNIFNYLNKKIINDELIKVQNVNRSLIDIDDVKNICEYCFNLKNKILNISNIEIIKVIDIVNIMSSELNKSTKKEIIDVDFITEIINNSLEVENAIDYIGIDKKNYTKKLIKKYIKRW
jgi:nucleoside-diphosphate-sugar epimerase